MSINLTTTTTWVKIIDLSTKSKFDKWKFNKWNDLTLKVLYLNKLTLTNYPLSLFFYSLATHTHIKLIVIKALFTRQHRPIPRRVSKSTCQSTRSYHSWNIITNNKNNFQKFLLVFITSFKTKICILITILKVDKSYKIQNRIQNFRNFCMISTIARLKINK